MAGRHLAGRSAAKKMPQGAPAGGEPQDDGPQDDGAKRKLETEETMPSKAQHGEASAGSEGGSSIAARQDSEAMTVERRDDVTPSDCTEVSQAEQDDERTKDTLPGIVMPTTEKDGEKCGDTASPAQPRPRMFASLAPPSPEEGNESDESPVVRTTISDDEDSGDDIGRGSVASLRIAPSRLRCCAHCLATCLGSVAPCCVLIIS